MILKIRRNYGELRAEVPEVIVECDRYDKRAYSIVDGKAPAAESMFCDDKGEVNPTITLHTFNKGKFADMFVLGHATVFVMNDDGKTIEIIYT